jgi:hypothetical protein
MTALVPALHPSSMLSPRGTSGYAIRIVQTESISNRWASNGELLPRTPYLGSLNECGTSTVWRLERPSGDTVPQHKGRYVALTGAAW